MSTSKCPYEFCPSSARADAQTVWAVRRGSLSMSFRGFAGARNGVRQPSRPSQHLHRNLQTPLSPAVKVVLGPVACDPQKVSTSNVPDTPPKIYREQHAQPKWEMMGIGSCQCRQMGVDLTHKQMNPHPAQKPLFFFFFFWHLESPLDFRAMA